MSKEMNKLTVKITKYDMMSGLFMSLIIALVFSVKIALVYMLGIIVGNANFALSVYATNKWLMDNRIFLILITFFRIIAVAVMIIPFIHSIELVFAYIIGFLCHFLVLIYCSIK